MSFIFAALSIYAIQWAGYGLVPSQWVFIVGTQLLTISLLVSGVSMLCKTQTILVRSVLVLWLLISWADVIKFVLWQTFDIRNDLVALVSFIFCCWLLFVLRRHYLVGENTAKTDTVTIFIKKPSSNFDMIKSLFGSPAPSLCLGINSIIWSFRKRTEVFTSFKITPAFSEAHIAIDTGVIPSTALISELNALVGTPRGNACKCIWTIRHPLNMLGGKFSIKTWFDYIPSFYVLRIL